MLTVYGVYRSRASRVYWMAEELGLKFRSVPVLQARRLADPLAPEAALNTHSSDFAAVNPMAQIPSIRDGEFVMHESLAINLYLARKYGGPLGGQTVEEDGLLTMWTVWAASQVEPQTVKIVLTYDDGLENSEDSKQTIAVACRLLRRPLAALESHLHGRQWIVGDRFTVADLNIAEVLRYAQSEEALFDAHPNIKAWIERCQSRPAYKAMQATRAKEPIEV
ncbi:glutathione S-transferase family protein [Rhizobium leguminosarum]|uniref:glutathione S-transferase family protein n=1 Tax=Rhizobium leguminosarum TaxID=384 RepID=UPI001C97E5B0|nr:glutathione S-transferase family protein [Rhizobium leguminosarum]MBY5748811.1 glutathione S-transferase family protein [Rhizobium leguminosarum]MBY5820952.1 glutathione S-transferase family protein [Rhizobium leguminosarum]